MIGQSQRAEEGAIDGADLKGMTDGVTGFDYVGQVFPDFPKGVGERSRRRGLHLNGGTPAAVRGQAHDGPVRYFAGRFGRDRNLAAGRYFHVSRQDVQERTLGWLEMGQGACQAMQGA